MVLNGIQASSQAIAVMIRVCSEGCSTVPEPDRQSNSFFKCFVAIDNEISSFSEDGMTHYRGKHNCVLILLLFMLSEPLRKIRVWFRRKILISIIFISLIGERLVDYCVNNGLSN